MTSAQKEFASASRRGSSQRQTTEGSRIKQRILVVQQPGDSAEQAEKIGLLVDEVSGHVLLDQASSMQSDRRELAVMLREQLNVCVTPLQTSANTGLAAEPSQQLLELVKGAWSAPAKVFLVELQQLFGMDAFTGIAALDRTARVAERKPEVLYT